MRPNDAADRLVAELVVALRAVLGRKVVGVYLFGSLVSGGFEPAVSDVDLLVATTTAIDGTEFAALRAMHDRFERERPAWKDRIEVLYSSLLGLRSFRERTSRLVVISPGDPLHTVDAGRDWLANWYLAREEGRTLFGPPPEELILPVTKAEFLAAIRAYAREFGARPDRLRTRTGQSYAILTLCRALFTHRTGEHISKPNAADWAARELPEWAWLIREALRWRMERGPGLDNDGEATFDDAVRFVTLIGGRISGG